MIMLRVFVIVLILALTGWLGWELYQAGYFERQVLEQWARESGVWAPLIIIGAIAMAVIIGPIPTMPVSVASGAIFGPVPGFIYSMLGGLLGAGISFWIARLAGQPLIEKLMSGRVSFCENCSDRLLFYVVMSSRLIPVFSFALVSYGAGLTHMGTFRFLLATALGMTPMTVVFVAIGTGLTINPWIAGGGGLLAVILLLVLPKLAQRYNLFGLDDYIHRDQQD